MRSSSAPLSLRACRRLQSRKERRETGRFLVEGIRQVRAALESSHAIELILHAPGLLGGGYGQETVDMARARGIPCLTLSNQEFQSIATRENPRGIACVGRQAWSSLDRMGGVGKSMVALYQPQDPGNLGTILRTCDATGVSGAILIGDAVDPWHPAAVRAAMGATFALDLAQCDVASFIAWTRRQGLPVVGTSDRAVADYATHPFPDPFVLLMGSERQGLPPELEAVAGAMVRIPMAGACDSLNLAIATALVLYEARNQRARIEEVA